MAKQKPKITRLTVPLTDEERWQLERLAKRQGLGVELFVGQLIRERLAGERGD